MWVSEYHFRKIITRIKNKLKLSSMQIVKADKGTSIIKTFQNDYNDKIAYFFLWTSLTLCARPYEHLPKILGVFYIVVKPK
jgi:hypothetical protein